VGPEEGKGELGAAIGAGTRPCDSVLRPRHSLQRSLQRVFAMSAVDIAITGSAPRRSPNPSPGLNQTVMAESGHYG
jgi:hypothetical protein